MCYSKGSSLNAPTTLIRLDLLAGDPQGASCPYLPSAGIPGAQHPTLHTVLSLDNDSYLRGDAITQESA